MRAVKGLSQEQFDVVSGRTYLSSLERGLKIPTLGKVEDLAQVLEIHPATLIALCYCSQLTEAEFHAFWSKVREEGSELIAMHDLHRRSERHDEPP